MKQLGPLAYCLGVQVLRNREKGTIALHQTKYLADILNRFNLSVARPMPTPLAAGVKLSSEDQPTSDQEKLEMQSVPYRQAIGCLIYLSVWTRFDISKATQETAQHSQNPGPKHWSAVKRIYRYLSGTKKHGLVYQGTGTSRLSLIGWSDADWAADVDQRQSVAAFVCTINGVAVSWACKLMPTVCLSSTESEYGALTRAGKEAVSARVTMKDLHKFEEGPTRVYSDSQSAIALSLNARFHARTRHIEVSHHFIHHLVSTQQVELIYVNTEDNLSDLLTKGLLRERHEKLMTRLGLLDCSALIEEAVNKGKKS